MYWPDLQTALRHEPWGDTVLGLSRLSLSTIAFLYWRNCKGIDARDLYLYISIFMAGTGITRFSEIIAVKTHAIWAWDLHFLLKYVAITVGVLCTFKAVRLFSHSRDLLPRHSQFEVFEENQKEMLRQIQELRLAVLMKPAPDVSLADRAIRATRLPDLR